VVTTLLFALAVLALPVVLVIAVIVLLGSAVVGMSDGAANGLVRPNPS
jgi:hypothetical protein